jgi:hypothetical protein
MSPVTSRGFKRGYSRTALSTYSCFVNVVLYDDFVTFFRGGEVFLLLLFYFVVFVIFILSFVILFYFLFSCYFVFILFVILFFVISRGKLAWTWLWPQPLRSNDVKNKQSHYSYWQVCSVLYTLSHLAFSGYPDWGFSVLFPQLEGKCQGIPRKDGAQSALFLISVLCCSVYCLCRLCCSMYGLFVNVYCTSATGCQPSCS